MERFEAAGVGYVLEADSAGLVPGKKGEPFGCFSVDADLIVVLGGDGTILWTVRQLGREVKPIAAINTGTLGFLTCATAEESERLVEAIVAGELEMTNRLIIEGAFEREGEVAARFVALNEVTLCRGADSRVIHVNAWIDDVPANRYTGDGLILATPTGSTAYSLSAGGPLVQPGSDVLVVTPICPHTLANRPLVVSAGSEIVFEIPEQRDGLSLLVDGQLVTAIEEPGRVTMRRAGFSLPLASLPGQNFFGVLHQKLGWTGSAV